jgi:hypothetical protein
MKNEEKESLKINTGKNLTSAIIHKKVVSLQMYCKNEL